MNRFLPIFATASVMLAAIAPPGGGGGVRGAAGSPPALPPDKELPAGMALGPLPPLPQDPVGNPGTPGKRTLGRQLFFDPVLSDTRTVSCATCHHPKYGWADGRTVPLGVGGTGLGPRRQLAEPSDLPVLPRNTPTLLNVGFNGLVSASPSVPELAPMFWDSRTLGLESQVPVPLGSAGEMCATGCIQAEAVERALKRLRAIPAYVAGFRTVFGPGNPDTITGVRLSQAIAAFERSLVSRPTAFDRFLAGEDAALSTQQREGLRAFQDAGCIQCHGGPMFSDYQLHVIGVPDLGGNGGRAFRTPSLRNLRQTAPYMHNGSLRSLRDVLRFYEELDETVSETLDGADIRNPALDPLLRRLRVDPAEFPALEAFLECLSADEFDTTVPATVPSGLPVEHGD